jgi:hypothetical protein
MQRDVEFEVDSIDKSGGFIGSLYLNKTENAALTLVKEGLATVHSFSADDTEVSGFLLLKSQEYSHDYLTGRSKASSEKCKRITKLFRPKLIIIYRSGAVMMKKLRRLKSRRTWLK